MSLNKKIWFGDNYTTDINGGIILLPPEDLQFFTFDSTAITFDSTIETFDYDN
jgi:hypothetical protein